MAPPEPKAPPADPQAAREAELDASRAPLMEHLVELRQRVWRAVIGILVAAVGCSFFYQEIFEILTEPAYAALDTLKLKSEMSFRQPAGAFMFYFKGVMLAAFFVAVPILLSQIWGFVAPGLYRSERRMALPFVVLSTLCFLGGAAFAYHLVLPPAFEFLLGFGTEGPRALRPDLNLEDYLGFTMKLLLAFGLVFEMPVAVAFFAGIGLVTHRGMIRWWRWAVVGAFVLGALLTPPDYVTQVMLAIPLFSLYGLSIGIAYLITTRRDQALAEGDPPPDSPPDPPAP